MGDTYVAWLSDLSKKSLPLAGGKGANLGEMFNAGFPVPQAFVVTTDAFFYFLKETKLEDEIKGMLSRIDVDDTHALQTKAKEIRELIINTKMPEVLEKDIVEAYDHFNVDLDGLKDSPGALAILKSAREPIFVSVRSSATAEDLGDASFAGQQESFINVKGNSEVVTHVKKVFASIFTARSIYYRKKKGFEGMVGIAAIVQKMINSEKSGVMFSKHPVNGKPEILIEAVYGQGEGIVSGRIKPDQHTLSLDLDVLDEKIADKKLAIIRTASGQTKTIELKPEISTSRVLKTHELKALGDYALKLEKHYSVPQDIEFALENNEIFILQTRPITTLGNKQEVQDIDGELITSGLAASPGVASGVVKLIHSMDDLSKIKEGDVLVTTMTNPDMVVSMQKACAIVTSEGGVTAHAAIVSREMGIPAVVGAQDALDKLHDGMEITVDGFNGKVFSGVAENRSVEIKPIVDTKTKIKVMVDLPKFAERAAKTNADGIGLIRLEGLIASSGMHPLKHEKEGTLEKYEAMLYEGLKEIAEKFIGKPIWIRSSDIRSDEYANLDGAPKEIEKNPMLGYHGIRFSLQHDGIFRSELRALRRLAESGHKFGVMFPQIISVEEVTQARKIFDEEKCSGKVQFGVMVETPAASMIIKEICEQGIDFISFGTNDLTQYTLAIDRGNEDVQYIYDEMNPSVLKQLSMVIQECKKHNVETSICGQAGSKPEMVKYLVGQGIDSISVNADAAQKISMLVQRLENGEDVAVSSEKQGQQQVPIAAPQEKKEEVQVETQEVVQDDKKDEESQEQLVDEESKEHAQGGDAVDDHPEGSEMGTKEEEEAFEKKLEESNNEDEKEHEGDSQEQMQEHNEQEQQPQNEDEEKKEGDDMNSGEGVIIGAQEEHKEHFEEKKEGENQ